MGRACAALLASAVLVACGPREAVPRAAGAAEAATVESNARFAMRLTQEQPADLAEAQRGLVARASGKILGADGAVLADLDSFEFLEGSAPATVNPSLWRHAQLNSGAGLYRVTDGIWQLRGFDISNITLVRGQTGWIVVDALAARESAAAAMSFAREHLGDRPVSAIVFTHSHADHFAGVLGILSTENAAARRVPVIAPQGFMEEATGEHILAGPAMARRSQFQFGKNLEHSPIGLVDNGLGKQLVYGSAGILEPTQLISLPSEEVVLDGVRFIFHNTPDSEAPAELTFSIPALKAFGGAEILSQTMHNLLPLRGGKVRNALRWAQHIQQALDELGDTEVLFGQHNWPVWGRDRIASLMIAHRDVYKYTHDQTVRLMNAGLTPGEIAERIRLPASLQSRFGARGNYGDLRHNSKAVYQYYLGSYDGNPAQLDPLPPTESARRYVRLMGGLDKVMAAAQSAFDEGDYRWAAELLHRGVFAAPGNEAASMLLARTYEQLGYQAESASWRNAYLTGATELRNGVPRKGLERGARFEQLLHTPMERLLEGMAASLDGAAAEGKDLKLNLVFTDLRESYFLWIENAVLHFRKGPPDASADATLTVTSSIFLRLMIGTASVKDALLGDDFKVSGSRIDLVRFVGLFDRAPQNFPIVTR